MPTSISGLGGTPPSSATPTGSNQLGKNEFLKLLTAQLANQDPLSPTDNQAFIAQLAQFASVEQQEAANHRLDSLIVAQAAANQTSVATLVGKDITYRTDSVVLPAAGGVGMQGELAADAKQANAIITDQNGRVVRTLTLQNAKAGTVDFQWDGLDDRGQRVAPGTYKIKLTAADSADKSVAFDARGHARATGVTFANGYPELVINGARVKLSDIVQISEASTPTTTSTGA
jgi:flagellar basal-body rod modification protein FlgD